MDFHSVSIGGAECLMHESVVPMTHNSSEKQFSHSLPHWDSSWSDFLRNGKHHSDFCARWWIGNSRKLYERRRLSAECWTSFSRTQKCRDAAIKIPFAFVTQWIIIVYIHDRGESMSGGSSVNWGARRTFYMRRLHEILLANWWDE